MDCILKKLTSNDSKEIFDGLEQLSNEISPKFNFPELNQNDYRSRLWQILYGILINEGYINLHKLCLQVIRILSREKVDLDKLVTKEYMDQILYHAALKDDKDISGSKNHEIALEALMCLCNITYNATIPRSMCCRTDILQVILNRWRSHRDMSSDIKYFDMKILFIITALCANVRETLKDEMHGLTYLKDYLELILNELKESNHNSDVSGEVNKLSTTNANLSIEILKTLFNLTMRPKPSKVIDEGEEDYYVRLVAILNDFLLINVESVEKKLELDGHIMNLLLNIPDQCLKPLIPLLPKEEVIASELRYENHNMSSIHEMLRYFKSRFASEPSVSNQNEILSPVLSAMIKLAKSERVIRKYLRVQVLPPLKDTHTRPEQGDKIRNCLCRLLTSPITQVRDLAADFLFVLCKENAKRMIKYTGYGNAAGMFASRGLLNGQDGDTQNYSSDSEDSETEEYNEFKHGINPVTGCYQEPKPSPTANMTEEQKEVEALKLVNLIDNLTKTGITPCRIGADGRPEPIEHVLQLQDYRNNKI